MLSGVARIAVILAMWALIFSAVIPLRDVAAQPQEALRQKPWASHAGCAEIARRFDFGANSSDWYFRRFTSCVNARKELPDWRSSKRPVLLLGEDFPVTVTPSPLSPPGYWVLPAWDYVVSNSIRRGGTFEVGELELLKIVAQPGDVVLDVGAHVGAYTVPLATHVGPQGAVHAFEPFRLVFQLLLANVAVNGISNVYGHQIALGNHEELRNVKGPALNRASNVGATRIFGQAAPHFTKDQVLQYGEEEVVRIAPLDAFNMKKVDVMKIDVEGSLDLVLGGAQRTIGSHRPVLVVEHAGDEPPDMLVEWQYRCVALLQQHELWACVPHEKVATHSWFTQSFEMSERNAEL